MKIWPMLLLIPAILFARDNGGHELAWLAGCWTTPDNKAREVWVVDMDNSLAGFAVSVRDDSVSFYEVLSINRDENGLLVYTAYPSGQAGTSFVGMEISDNNALFVNAEHDYPQAIRYRRHGQTLSATISMLDGSRENTFDKVACD